MFNMNGKCTIWQGMYYVGMYLCLSLAKLELLVIYKYLISSRSENSKSAFFVSFCHCVFFSWTFPLISSNYDEILFFSLSLIRLDFLYEFIYQIYQIYQNIHNTDIVYIPIISFPVFSILFLLFPKHFLMIFFVF